MPASDSDASFFHALITMLPAVQASLASDGLRQRRQTRMARLAISELTTFRWSFEEDVEQYRSAGANAIGVWRQKLADVGEERGAAILSAAGLAVSSLQWAGGFTGSDGHSHQESIADA